MSPQNCFPLVLFLLSTCCGVSHAGFSEEDIQLLARQVLLHGEQAQSRVRSEGTSGVVQVKNYVAGPDNYFSYSHIGRTPASMHDHPDRPNVLGYGQLKAVLNGVEFQTRHNDPMLVRPSNTSLEWHAVEPIQHPPVPPSVTGELEDQINEMVEYFRAFKTQNITHRDYRKYFRPVLCYLEGAWLSDYVNIEEPFPSIKHRKFYAKTYGDMLEQARLQAHSGADRYYYNYVAELPRALFGVNDTDLQFAQWQYRIVCHPFSGDLPTQYFRVREDFAYQARFDKGSQDRQLSRGTIFTLDDQETLEQSEWSILDEIISEIPGKNNYGSEMLTDSSFMQRTARHPLTRQPLNMAFYSNKFIRDYRDLMRETEFVRGFSDTSLYMALTTQPQVAQLPIDFWETRNIRIRPPGLRFSYMIPLEVLYLTPLYNWNPCGVKTTHVTFFQTPSAMFDNLLAPGRLPSEVYKLQRMMPDSSSVKHAMAASGIFTVLPSIKNGVGNVRLRYPIFPVHFEGHPLWKEFNAFKNYISQQLVDLKALVALT